MLRHQHAEPQMRLPNKILLQKKKRLLLLRKRLPKKLLLKKRKKLLLKKLRQPAAISVSASISLTMHL